MDNGFHAPTMSFPVARTLMIEPTESETLVLRHQWICHDIGCLQVARMRSAGVLNAPNSGLDRSRNPWLASSTT